MMLHKKITIFCFIVVLLFGVAPLPSLAANDSSQTVEDALKQKSTTSQSIESNDKTLSFSKESDTSVWGSLLQVLFSLAVVVILIYVVFRFLSKRQFNGLRGNGPFRNLGGVPLGNGKSLQIVQVGDSLYIVGVGENVQLLRHIPAGDEMDVLLSGVEMKPATDHSISNWLLALRKGHREDVYIAGTNEHGSFEDLLEKQWSEINHAQGKRRDLEENDNHGNKGAPS